MKSTVLSYSSLLYFVVLLFVLQSCSSQKGTAEFAGMQNLTAKFNILYNSRILLEEIESNIESSYYDDYNQTLSVYIEPTSSTSASQTDLLDSVITKAKRIIDEKSSSNYVDDAYLLIATAQYLKANFFDAAEYFNYIYRTYPGNRQLSQISLVMKARAELQLGNLTDAKNTLDTAFKYFHTDERSIADIFATRAQLFIKSQKDAEAAKELQKALISKSPKKHRIRWRYVLGQLQMGKGELAEAYNSFKAVGGSNAPYEMAFNASVNRLLIEDELKGGSGNFIVQLQNLLNDDKNRDFADQIFYRIAELHRSKEQIKAALDNYNKTIRVSTYNKSQKGLAYLRIADLYFNAAKYSTAKLYLDSTLTTLPVSFPGYEQIKKKSDNLDLLASRLQSIAHEEKLQALAKLPESERDGRLANFEQSAEIEGAAPFLINTQHSSLIVNSNHDGKFYFNNSSALSQGLSDFKKIWGNRQLEDHWRRSEKISVDDSRELVGVNNPTSSTLISPSITNSDNGNNTDLPLTAEKLALSNQRIINAMYDIAVFYKDELEDTKQAIITFQNILSRFPDNSNAIAINYYLYRLYESLDSAKADYYKSIILTRHPESNFAKVIADPQFIDKADNREAALNEIYDHVYNLYTQKKYDQVISRVKEVEKDFGNNKLSPHFAYLNALSVGKTQKLPPFEDALNAIVKLYPGDQVISPLVKQHLRYIDLNRIEFNGRTVALADQSETDKEFADDTQIQEQVTQQLSQAIQSNHSATAAIGVKEIEELPASPVLTKIEDKESLFSLPDSAEYYFVVNVLSPEVNLSSSRFGIGQFNRTHLKDEPIKHQLMHVNNENQLILVGSFNNKITVMDYDRRISPLLKEIMKIPVGKYNTFVITKDGLDKLKDSILINSYLDFYKNSK